MKLSKHSIAAVVRLLLFGVQTCESDQV